MKMTTARAVLFAALICFVFGAWVRDLIGPKYSCEDSTNERTPVVAVSASVEVDAEWTKMNERKDKMIKECYDHKCVPTMGFGFSVVCICDDRVLEYDTSRDKVLVHMDLKQ